MPRSLPPVAARAPTSLGRAVRTQSELRAAAAAPAAARLSATPLPGSAIPKNGRGATNGMPDGTQRRTACALLRMQAAVVEMLK